MENKIDMKEMHKTNNIPVSEDGLLKKGLIVRVLILPGHIEDAKNIINYLYKTFGDSIIISIMNQYTPVNKCKYDNLNRKVIDEEYNEVIDFAADLGIINAFVQEGDAAEESFIPDFNKNKIQE